MTDTLRPLALDDRTPSHAQVSLPWPLVCVLNDLAADEGATRAHAFHAVLGLVLRRFTGNDELLARIDGDANARGVRTLTDDAATFRSALHVVRDACEATDRVGSCLDDTIAIDVLGAAACSLRGHATDEYLKLTLASDAHGLGAATSSVLDALAVQLSAIVAQPDVACSTLPLTHSAALEQLLWRADGPRMPREGVVALDRIVADRAARTPGAVAVIDGSTKTTFGELCERSQAIATALRRRAVAPGDRVGVCMDASADLFATILGIWSAGAVYVPLDPGVPHERLGLVAQDAGIALAVVARANAHIVFGVNRMIVEDIASASDDPRPSQSAAGGSAYILYTSGSTGTPKGVEISHAAAANAILGAIDVCAFDKRDVTLYRTAISFDLSVYDIFCALVSGAMLVVAPRSAAADPLAIADLVEEHAITHLLLGPALLAALLERRAFDRCGSLRIVTCGGEALPRSLVERFSTRSAAALYNLYGPSEATMLVTLHRCVMEDVHGREASAPLGRPLANTHVSVRDAQQWPVPLGAIGEITIGGLQLAAGYINRPDETASAFVGDPARPGRRLYRTGDLARLQLDGSIVFLSRNDKQVKIRGNRVEPAEVAAAIERIAGVQTAVVCAHRRVVHDLDATFVLVAYALLNEASPLTSNAIRDRLRATLPQYMVPIEVVLIDAFPLTVSGKIDEKALAAGSYCRRAIPVEAGGGQTSREYSLRGITREQVRMIWESLLARTNIGDYDNFFDIGGDSLLAVRLMLQIEEAFGQSVALSEFFDTMTIAGLAASIASGTVTSESEAVTLNASGSQIPFVYLHGDFAGGSYAWSLAHLLGIDQPLTVIAPYGIPGRPVATNVTAMARGVVAMIERLHPFGALRIGGYSAAGLVAYEVARQLCAAGRDVRDVVLVATAPQNGALAALRGLMTSTDRANGIGDRILRGIVKAGAALTRVTHTPVRRVVERLGEVVTGGSAQPVLDANELELGHEYAAYERAHAAYVPASYSGRLTILHPTGELDEAADFARAWRRIAPQANISPVPGTHHGAVSRHLDEIADEIRHRFA